jgi:L-iditol 2-dehydrogenase
MKAVILRANQVLEYVELPIPVLAADECRVAVRAAGVCSSDVPRAFDSGAYFYPLIMGHELAGEVVACGKTASSRFRAGDRVVVFPLIPCGKCAACASRNYARCVSYDYYGSRRHGGFAEYLNVRDWNLLRLPDGLSFEDAALVEPVAVVVHALDKAGLLRQDSVHQRRDIAILGAGFLGLNAVQILRMLCPQVSVTLIDRNDYKLQVGARAGAAVEHLADEQAWGAYLEANRGRFPVILEASGVPHTFRMSLELAEPGGTVVWMGNISDSLELPQKLVSSVLRKELHILGTWNSTYQGDGPSDWLTTLGLMRRGLRPSALVSHQIGLEGVAETMGKLYAHKRRRERHDILKVLVKPDIGASGEPVKADE